MLGHCEWIRHQDTKEGDLGSEREPRPGLAAEGGGRSRESIVKRMRALARQVSPLLMNLQVGNFQRCKYTQLLYCSIVLFKALCCKIKMLSLFFVFVFLCIICMKSIINLL